MALFPLSAIVLAVLCLLPFGHGVYESQETRGLFIGTSTSRVELTAFAEPTHGRRLQMASGALEDVPTLVPRPGVRIFSRMPGWHPSEIVLGSAALFNEDDDIETRTLPFATRRVNVYASDVRVASLEDPGNVVRLLASVDATEDNPGYLYVVMLSSGLLRYYPVRLVLEK
jgi:hypothetical protein